MTAVALKTVLHLCTTSTCCLGIATQCSDNRADISYMIRRKEFGQRF